MKPGQKRGALPAEDVAVRSRRVYYISGFDPRGPSYYHRLYRDEGAKQSVHHTGAEIVTAARRRLAPHVHAWNVEAKWQEGSVSTDYRFLGWDDIVRRHWEPNLLRLLVEYSRGIVEYASSGAFAGLRKNFRGPLYAALYPVAFLFLLVAVSLLFGYGAGAIAGGALSSSAVSLICAITAAAGTFRAGLVLAERLGIPWLLRIILFVYTSGKKEVAGLEERIEQFAEIIRRDQAERPCDEVLLVGHSVGSIVSVSVAARLAKLLSAAQQKNVTLVTLGQCIPLLSLMPSAERFRADLATVAAANDLTWYDMNARADSLCFAQANPVDVSGLGAGQNRPVQLVVRPFKMFDARQYARLKRNKLRLHFQYLMASALPNEYDYFRMTAGPARIKPF